jgi:hypothetical protein
MGGSLDGILVSAKRQPVSIDLAQHERPNRSDR